MNTKPASAIRALTAGSLATAGLLHVAWGRGSSFPFGSTAELTDNVVGSSVLPSPAACYSVASALAAVSLVVVTPTRGRLHQTLLRSMALGFATRAAFGFAGRTDVLVPGSSSTAFRRNDRRILAPICVALAAGITWSARRPK